MTERKKESSSRGPVTHNVLCGPHHWHSIVTSDVKSGNSR